MRVFGKLIVSAAALAIASSLTFVSAGAVPTAGKMSMSSKVVLAAGKKAKAKKAGPGHCGAMKYWDKKTRSCADATAKKS
jgi:hypothetical protein